MNKIDDDIRSKIIFNSNPSQFLLETHSNIELVAILSKNYDNFIILKSLLEKNKNNMTINEILIKTVRCLRSTSSTEAVKLLIKYGANINCIIDRQNWTLLMDQCIAPKCTNLEIINFLIENDADVNVKNCCDSQPLSLLIKFSSNDEHLEIIKLLISKGS